MRSPVCPAAMSSQGSCLTTEHGATFDPSSPAAGLLPGAGEHEGPRGLAGQGSKGTSQHLWTLAPAGGPSRPEGAGALPGRLGWHSAAAGRPRAACPAAVTTALAGPSPALPPALPRGGQAAEAPGTAPVYLPAPGCPAAACPAPQHATSSGPWCPKSARQGQMQVPFPAAAPRGTQRLLPASCSVSHAPAALGLL